VRANLASPRRYVPSLRARACARDPTTIVVIETLLLLPSFPGLEAGARDKCRVLYVVVVESRRRLKLRIRPQTV
jgi:hypothetical protein